MFEKVNIPIPAIIENMSIHICSKCGHESISSAWRRRADGRDYDVEPRHLPPNMAIREMADGGKPTVVAVPGFALPNLPGIARRLASRSPRRPNTT